jgi:hypothetical protein
LFLNLHAVVAWQLGRQSQHGRLFLLVRADLPQRLHVRPDAFALGAFPHLAAADEHRFHVGAAARARFGLGRIGGLLAIRLGAAMRAKLLANKHHPEAGGTSHRGQARAAMFATGGVGGRRRAAHRTI